jgi:hypothetical protein
MSDAKLAMVDDTAPKTLSIPHAGKLYYNLGKNGSYAAARRGELPVIKVGSRFRVSVAVMERRLLNTGQK